MLSSATLDFASIVHLFSLNGAYQIAYSSLLGMSVWVSFFGGVIAYRVLPRQQFGALQHRTFPVYFMTSMVLSSFLIGVWTWKHQDIPSNITNLLNADVVQLYTLLYVLLAQGSNHFIIGPLTSKTMFQRHKQEKDEGKAYTEPGVSDNMKALNRKFAQLHGWSSLANLGAVIALIFHGLWIGNMGSL